MRRSIELCGANFVHIFKVRDMWCGQVLRSQKIAQAHDPLNLLMSAHIGFSIIFDDAQAIEEFSSAKHGTDLLKLVASSADSVRKQASQCTMLTVDELEQLLSAGLVGWQRYEKVRDPFNSVIKGSYENDSRVHLPQALKLCGDVCTWSILAGGIGAYRQAGWLHDWETFSDQSAYEEKRNALPDECACKIGMNREATERILPMDVAAAAG